MNHFRKKRSVIDVQLGSKYASVTLYLVGFIEIYRMGICLPNLSERNLREWLKACYQDFPWIRDVTWTYLTRSEDVQNVIWRPGTRLIYVLCPRRLVFIQKTDTTWIFNENFNCLSYFILKLFQSKMFIVCLHSHSQSRGLCKTQLNMWVLDTLLQTALMQKGDLIIFQTFLTNSLETFFVSSKLITSLQLRNCRGL